MRYGSHHRYPYWAKRAAAHSVSCHGGIFLRPIWRKPEDKVTDMGYPGDQGHYGGWGSEQPPPSPYAPGQGTTPSPYAPGQDAAPAQYAPGQGPPPYAPGQGTPPAPNGQDPFGSPPAHDPFGRPPAQDSYAEYGAYDRPVESFGYGDDLDSERSRMPLIIGCVAGAGVLIVAGVVVALSGSSSSSTKTTTAGASSSPGATRTASAAASPQTTPALGAKLKSRSTDPTPLTVAEVFKNDSFGHYKMTATSSSTNCGKDVHGAKFTTALKTAGCTQLLRATFTTTDGKLIGSVGVANLKTLAAAQTAMKAGSGKDAWLLPLAGTGTTKKIGKGEALGKGEVHGHYLVLSWVQRPDGKAIPTSQQRLVTAFVHDVIVGSNLGTALQFRGIDGKPYAG
jgi:hypothetical protein